MNEDQNWKSRTLLAGGLLGALTGLGVAYLLIRRAEERGERLRLRPKEGIKLGMGLLGLLRQVSNMGEGGE